MKLDLYRYSSGKEDTLGLLFIDCIFECYTLEDEYRFNKVHGETRIFPGTYKIKFRQVESKKTIRYRNRFDWFTWHLELQDVPDFDYVYIHLGNFDTDTDGCILVGSESSDIIDEDGRRMIKNSTMAFEKVYKKVQKALNNKETVTITIRDSGQWVS